MVKPKKCKVCGNLFTPARSLQPTCSLDCAVAYGLKHIAKVKASENKIAIRKHREAKDKAKTKAEWMKETQAVFNRWIRLRDSGKPCISCGRFHQGQMHAGHYRTTKAAPELRLEEMNCHAQCAPCNNHLSGNILEYRRGLIERYGIGIVEWLEGPHEPKHYTIEDLRMIKKEYSDRIKDMQ